MKLEHARIIVELMTNAGYVDDADEILGDRVDNDTPENTQQFVTNFDELIAEVNSALPVEERITLNMQKEYDNLK